MEVEPRLIQVVRRPDEVRTPGDVLPGIDRLVVVRNDRLGDLVLSLPAFAALRGAYPEARLSLVVRPDLVPLARMFTCADGVIGASADRSRLRALFGDERPDLAVGISRDASVARAAAAARVPHRIGTGYRLYSPFFTRTVGERRRLGGRHEVEYALSFAHRSGAPAGEATFPIEVPTGRAGETGDWLRSRRVEGSFVVLHPGSGGSCPGWPAGHYADLAARLESAGIRVVISFGPDDALVARELDGMKGSVEGPPRFNGEIERLTALLASADLVVSNSTGPLHLAAALGTPTLGFFAPWPSCSAVRWGPYASNGWAIEAAADEAVRWSRRRRERSGRALMAAISPETAAKCAMDLLQGRAPRI